MTPGLQQTHRLIWWVFPIVIFGVILTGLYAREASRQRRETELANGQAELALTKGMMSKEMAREKIAEKLAFERYLAQRKAATAPSRSEAPAAPIAPDVGSAQPTDPQSSLQAAPEQEPARQSPPTPSKGSN